jgi:hypothetical protein
MYRQIIYCSRLKCAYGVKDVYTILKKSRVKNARLGVSGFLLYKDNRFLQVIEGFNGSVSNLFRIIQDDLRHEEVKLITNDRTRLLQFENWYMGYSSLMDDISLEISEYLSSIGQRDVFDPFKIQPSEVRKLFSLFSNAIHNRSEVIF